jgi:ATP-dependent exoDNAse (exonuclease V) beta subunit
LLLQKAEFVVKEIKDLIEKKVLGSNPTVAIIYRTNAQSRELEEACVKMNLPYVIVGKATSFYQREEVKDCLCFLRWICNGLDETAMLRAFKTPSKGIGEKAIEEFASYYKKVVSFYTSQGKARLSPLDVLISLTDFRRDPAGALLSADAPTPNDTISKRAIKSLEKFSTQMRQIREVAYSESLDKLLSAIVEIFDFRSHVLAISNNSKEEFEERWGNVQELQVATKRYSNDIPCLPPRQQAKEDENSIPLANFLDDVALVADLEVEADAEGEEKRVVANLMTIHASKGKEFDAVFIVGNEDGTFPTMQAIEGNAEIDEERRLCYVAITRAKTYLYMTWRQEVNIYTEQGIRSRTAYRSRFLDKLVSNGVSQSAEPDQNGRDLRRSVALPSLSTNDRFKRFSSKSSRSYPKSSVPSDSSVPKYGDSRTRQSTSPTFDTTKVYGSKSHIFNDIASKASLSQRDETNRRQSPLIQRNYLQPVQPKSAKPKLSTSTSSSSQPQAFRPMSTTSARKPVESSKSKIPPATFNTKRSMSASVQQDDHLPQSPQPDSTWFYPIGSSVLHRDHGIGVVLQPPPRSFQSRNEKLWVRVEFETGEVLEFDAVGTDLLPN